MELWQIIAAVLAGAGGVVLVLQSMAMARESMGSTNTRVAVTGAITLLVAVVLTALVATVLPPLAAWVVVGVLALVLFVLSMVS